MLDMLKTLVAWVVGCWDCDGCTWFSLLVSVVSCVLRTVIFIAIIYAVSQFLGTQVNALVNSL